ncbi:MAG: hypothetical protein ACC655_08480, partial [Rhodothermia bacterium]
TIAINRRRGSFNAAKRPITNLQSGERMKRDRLMMFGAITALTLSLFWAVRFLPSGSHGIPGLLSIGSLLQTPPGPINLDTSSVSNWTRHIRIKVQHENRIPPASPVPPIPPLSPIPAPGS